MLLSKSHVVVKQKEKQHKKQPIYMASSTDDITRLAEVIRNHWSIENSQHWILDMAFREDGTNNMALFRRALLNLVKQHGYKSKAIYTE